MKEEKSLSMEEQLAAYEKQKAELLTAYHDLKMDLEYAADSVEEGLAKEKREKLSRQIKALAAKIDALGKEEDPA